MEPECSPLSQDPATRLCPEKDESVHVLTVCFFNIQSVVFSDLHLGFSSRPFPSNYISNIRATQRAQLILDLAGSAKYEASHSFPHHRALLSLSSLNILLSTLPKHLTVRGQVPQTCKKEIKRLLRVF